MLLTSHVGDIAKFIDGSVLVDGGEFGVSNGNTFSVPFWGRFPDSSPGANFALLALIDASSTVVMSFRYNVSGKKFELAAAGDDGVQFTSGYESLGFNDEITSPTDTPWGEYFYGFIGLEFRVANNDQIFICVRTESMSGAVKAARNMQNIDVDIKYLGDVQGAILGRHTFDGTTYNAMTNGGWIGCGAVRLGTELQTGDCDIAFNSKDYLWPWYGLSSNQNGADDAEIKMLFNHGMIAVPDGAGANEGLPGQVAAADNVLWGDVDNTNSVMEVIAASTTITHGGTNTLTHADPYSESFFTPTEATDASTVSGMPVRGSNQTLYELANNQFSRVRRIGIAGNSRAIRQAVDTGQEGESVSQNYCEGFNSYLINQGSGFCGTWWSPHQSGTCALGLFDYVSGNPPTSGNVRNIRASSSNYWNDYRRLGFGNNLSTGDGCGQGVILESGATITIYVPDDRRGVDVDDELIVELLLAKTPSGGTASISQAIGSSVTDATPTTSGTFAVSCYQAPVDSVTVAGADWTPGGPYIETTDTISAAVGDQVQINGSTGTGNWSLGVISDISDQGGGITRVTFRDSFEDGPGNLDNFNAYFFRTQFVPIENTRFSIAAGAATAGQARGVKIENTGASASIVWIVGVCIRRAGNGAVFTPLGRGGSGYDSQRTENLYDTDGSGTSPMQRMWQALDLHTIIFAGAQQGSGIDYVDEMVNDAMEILGPSGAALMFEAANGSTSGSVNKEVSDASDNPGFADTNDSDWPITYVTLANTNKIIACSVYEATDTSGKPYAGSVRDQHARGWRGDGPAHYSTIGNFYVASEWIRQLQTASVAGGYGPLSTWRPGPATDRRIAMLGGQRP